MKIKVNVEWLLRHSCERRQNIIMSFKSNVFKYFLPEISFVLFRIAK